LKKLDVTVNLGQFKTADMFTGTIDEVRKQIENLLTVYENELIMNYKSVLFIPEYSFYESPEIIHVKGVREETNEEFEARKTKIKKSEEKAQKTLLAKKAKLEKELENLEKEIGAE